MQEEIKVGLIQLKDNNLGDLVISDNTRYLIEKYLKKENINYKIKNVDIGTTELEEINISKKREKYNNFLEKKLNFYEKHFGKLKKVQEYKVLNEWYRTPYYLLIKHRVLKRLKDVDIICFAGGGLIKYHQQEFHLIINEITKFANKMNITVIFNAVGIESFEENDARCRILKKALNRKCVKAISTRDDIDSLNQNYITRKSIRTSLIADSALWSSETYGIKKKDSNIIGINVIRPEIFKDYLYDVDEEVLLKMYSETITKLKEKGYDIKLFSNGVIRDQKFILKIKEYMHGDDKFDEMIEPRCKKSTNLVEMISNYKIVLGTRLHSNIIAYSLGIPVVGIVWNIKQILFSKINNIEEYYITKENFNSDYVVSKILDAPNQKKLSKKYKDSAYKFIEQEFSIFK